MASAEQTGGSKNVIVSGGARGIGRALARYLLKAGHRVYIFDIDAEELRHTTDVHLASYKKDGKVSSAICNLRDVEEIRAKVREAATFFDGRIDVLINNGGIASPQWKDGATMEDPATLEQWQAYLETNLTAPFVMSQACIPYMKVDMEDPARHDGGVHNIHDGGKCIILIGSFRAHQSDPNQEGYASSKAGLLGLMQSMAISLGKKCGIRVNLVAPGRIKVAHECRKGDEAGESVEVHIDAKDVDDHPANRAGRPKDIADAVLYLLTAGLLYCSKKLRSTGELRGRSN